MSPYPKPGPIGGRLIREVVQFLKSRGVRLPIDSHILIATSGGIDSIALAHLLVHFGRRVVPRERIRLLHINHGWRGKDSDGDEEFVRLLAAHWEIPIQVFRLKPPQSKSGESWEALARTARREIFEKEGRKHQASVFTAHHADDLAETLIWRLMTGAARTHGSGILFQEGRQMRPLLRIRKSYLRSYLLEQKVSWRDDSTNLDNRFLRARMRQDLMPLLETLFPKSIGHLVDAALQNNAQQDNAGETPPLNVVFASIGSRTRRAHWEAIQKKARDPRWRGEFHLPNGWRLRREKRGSDQILDRWVLEKKRDNSETDR
jgi:tRNA(Ile)-lysidine synthetase-like protein